MAMSKQLLAFILWLLICLLSSNINTEARTIAAANEGNQVGRFLLPSLNSGPLLTKPQNHEHNRAITSHQARNTQFLYHQAVQAPPSSGDSMASEGQQPTWCIAKPSTDEQRLLANIDFSCIEAGINCSIIQPGGKCYSPYNNYAHASVVMNLYYKANNKQPHTCYFLQSGLIISQDPSYGDCIYPS
ncbi:hypothetical protein Ddye_022160 [Dipteronia dyeriana]|uniref:X8 domain-containing protein n=1 Tax=Dipteronia dyeriana TaxID=168575 RepID=A0AAD9WYN5_9ROSI|nr:hypothetical protein Ddye_022160 [Dipteronia dyeriana]